MVTAFDSAVLGRIAAALLLVLVLGPTASVASTCASDQPPASMSDHGGHAAAAGQDGCCDEDATGPDCSGATPCASPCGVLPTALVLDAKLSAAALALPIHRPGSLAVPPPRPPPIR